MMRSRSEPATKRNTPYARGVLLLSLAGFLSLGAECHDERFVKLAEAGPGFYTETPNRWGIPLLVYGLMQASYNWGFYVLLPAPGTINRVRITDMSQAYPGQFGGHASHRCGIDVDIGPWGRTDAPFYGTYRSAGYSRDRTNVFIRWYSYLQVMPIDFVIFDDGAIVGDGSLVNGGRIFSDGSHGDHFHTRIRPNHFDLPGECYNGGSGGINWR